MKPTIPAFLLLLLLPYAALAQDPTWTERLEPVRIADNLHYVGTAGLSAFLLTSDEGHVLIDAPLEENVPVILENIRGLGFDPADVRVLIASHAHFDHVGGMAAMLDATGADLVLSAADARFIGEGADFGLNTRGYAPAVADRIVGHLDVVRVGDIELTAHLTPGHTPGCTTWSGTVTIAGEPLEFVSVCSLSVLPNYRLVGDDLTYAGQSADYCRSVAHLETLNPDIFLGSHGGWFGLNGKAEALRAGDARAFVEGERYRSYLSQARASIERALADQGHTGGCAALLR